MTTPATDVPSDSFIALMPSETSADQLRDDGVVELGAVPIVVLRDLGSAETFTQIMQDWVANEVTSVAAQHPKIVADVSQQVANGQSVAAVSTGVMTELRDGILAALPIDQLPEDVAAESWGNDPLANGSPTVAVMFDRVRVQFGQQYTDAPLNPDQPVAKTKFRIAKSDDVKRYTLSPWYVPNVLDAHDEWTDPDSLQAAVWNYVRANDRTMRLQHQPDTAVGEWVEIMSWPFEVTVPQTDPDTGASITVTYPPGTVFLGVIWNDTGWGLVTSGAARGLSIGGFSLRLITDATPDAQQTP